MINSDDATTGSVIAALAASPEVSAVNLRVRTTRGWIRLEGTVDTLAEKAAAADIAEHVPGVVSVENDLVVSSDGSVADLEIERAVADRLVGEHLANVGVRTQAGTAFVMGVVPSLAVEQRVIDVASAVKGVRAVVSELEIAAGEPVDDVTLANDVAEALSDDARLEVMDLHVQVKDGSVLLAGKVTSRDQLGIATAVAEAVPGVQYVESRMRVRRRRSSIRRLRRAGIG